MPLISTIPSKEDIYILRIGDTQKDDINLKGLETRGEHVKVFKYCTKPEIEILIIINEGLFDEYLKTANKIKPKTFVKNNLGHISIEDYFEKHDMLQTLKKYKELKKKHHKDELYLVDILDCDFWKQE